MLDELRILKFGAKLQKKYGEEIALKKLDEYGTQVDFFMSNGYSIKEMVEIWSKKEGV